MSQAGSARGRMLNGPPQVLSEPTDKQAMRLRSVAPDWGRSMTDAASVLDCRSGSILPEGGTMPDVPRLRERVNRSLRVRIIVHGGSETLYEQFAAALTLRREATADFLLTIELRDAPSAAVFVEQVGQLAQREDALLIVSDRFTPNPDGAGQD